MIRFWRAQSEWDDELKMVNDRTDAPELVAQTSSEAASALERPADGDLGGIQAEGQPASERAVDAVRRAAALLEFAEGGVTSLEAACRAAEMKLIEANARTEEAYAHIDRLEKSLWAADQRAKASEQRAAQAEEALMAVQDAIRRQLLEGNRFSAGQLRTAA